MTAMRLILAGWMLPLAAAAGPPGGPAARAPASGPAAGPLAGLPSKAGPHIEKIRALGDNEWLVLGPPSGDPKWGAARGRAWGARALTYAPGLGGAFFCGTGIHGFVKPDGHYMDDLWFYDLNGHRWICLYPGAHCKTLKLHLDAHGFEVNDAGEHVPVSYLSHAYGNSTYNPDLRKFTIIWCNCPWWSRAIPQRWAWLDQKYDSVKRKNYGGPGPVIANNSHPLFWDVAAGKWQRRFVAGPGPNDSGAAVTGVTEYIPSLKKTFFARQGSSRVWLYDYAANSWTSVKASGKAPGHNGCYEPKRGRVYSAGGSRLAYFDLKAKAWTDVRAEGQPEDFYSSNGTCMAYDAANDAIVFHMRPHGNIAVYDPAGNRWIKVRRTFPENVPTKYMSRHGYYDPALNVHLYYLAGDSRNKPATMLAYRYGKGE